ncbi:MAG: asparaginase [Pseudomonadota bacterium]
MDQGIPMVEIWRGDRLESLHCGHAVIARANGEIVEAWGAPDEVIFPRSACKMIQALPLLRSGAARAAGLGSAHLALACASHQGARLHHAKVSAWLAARGLSETDLRCGCQTPSDSAERDDLIRARRAPTQTHNNCSGKHAGFLTLAQHLKAGPEYIEIDHPVQRAAREAMQEVTGAACAEWAIDGCSAPSFATPLSGLARAMARFAAARAEDNATASAMVALREAMMAHPELVAGETRACTELMRAVPGVALKTGAEGVFTAILPSRGLGIALKITDGTTRAAEAVITRLLIRAGALDPAHPAALTRLGPIRNWRGLETGRIAAASTLD